ncbi:hypothetical protein ACHAPT_000623 [Fusarium lateritium]
MPVMQTITFTGETLSLCRKIYNNGQPDPALNDYSQELSKISETLRDNLDRGSGPLSNDDLALCDTAKKCLEVANKLSEELQELSPPNGQKRVRTSIRLGFKTIFRKSRLEQLETSLKNIQSAMNTQLLVRTLDRVDASTIQQQGALTDSRRLLEETIQQCSSRNDKKLDLIAKGGLETRDQLLQAMNNAQSRMEAHIKSESSKNTQLLQTHIATVENTTQRQVDKFQEWKDRQNEEFAYQLLLQSLKFENMEERKNQVSENYPQTCRWIFEELDEDLVPCESEPDEYDKFQERIYPIYPGKPSSIFEGDDRDSLHSVPSVEEAEDDDGPETLFSPAPRSRLLLPPPAERNTDDKDEPFETNTSEERPSVESWDLSTEIVASRRSRPPSIDLADELGPELSLDWMEDGHVHTGPWRSTLAPADRTSNDLDERPWDSFVSWVKSSERVYWISGKPGSGKSTLMKFISSSLKTRKLLSEWQAGVQIFSHYFWKAGSEMQQSLKGLLCSLVYQIFGQNRQVALDYLHKTREIRQRPASIADWDTKKLEALLRNYIATSTRGICFFIDGLDEFTPQRDFHDLLSLLERLSGPRVKLCLSSRPEQVLQNHLQVHAKLRMQDLTESDMRKYAAGSLRRAISPTDQELHTDAVVDLIIQKADGVFLWVVLVSKSLVRGIENGDSNSELRRRLDSMPGDLAALYKDMWLRSNDDREIYQKTASWFFNIIFAAECGTEGAEHVETLACMKHSSVTVFELMAATDPAVLDKFLDRGHEFPAAELDRKCAHITKAVETRSAGLLEVSDDYVRKNSPMAHLAQCLYQRGQHNALEHHADMTVRFIHRTARDYLLDSKDGRSLWQTSEISANEARTRLIKACLLRCYIWPFPEAAWRLGSSELGSFLLSASRTADNDGSPPVGLLSAIERAYQGGKLWSRPAYESREMWPKSQEEPKELEARFLLWAGLSGLVGYTVGRIPRMQPRDDLHAILDALLHQFCQGDEARHENRDPLIRCLLKQGATPDMDGGTLTSPWILYLKKTFDVVLRSKSAMDLNLNRAISEEISQTLRMFLEAGASLSGDIPILITLNGPRLGYECITALPRHPPFTNALAAILSVNNAWLINEITGHLHPEANTTDLGHERVPPSAKAVMAMYRDGKLGAQHRCWRIQQDEDAFRIADNVLSRLRSSAGASVSVQGGAVKELQDMMLKVKSRSKLVDEAEVPGFLRTGPLFHPGW